MIMSKTFFERVLMENLVGHIEISVIDQEPEEFSEDSDLYYLEDVTIIMFDNGKLALKGTYVYEDGVSGTVRMGSDSWEIWDERKPEFC